MMLEQTQFFGGDMNTNFHKSHLPEELRKYCLGTEKLDFILEEITQRRDLDPNNSILIPFGGPGSIAHYFDFRGISTISGDLEHTRKYKNPYVEIEKFRKKFRKKYNSVGARQFFIAWDATELPIERNSQGLAIVNPPFGVECDVGSDPIKLSINVLKQLEGVLKDGGVAYYVFPNSWINDFLNQVCESGVNMSPEILYKNISSNPDSKLPLCLIRIEKMSAKF